LFEARREQAMNEQEGVLSHLDRAGHALDEAAPLETGGQSARQLADLARELDEVRRELEPLAALQAQARREAAADTSKALKSQDQVAKTLATAAARHPLPATVSARINDARQAA